MSQQTQQHVESLIDKADLLSPAIVERALKLVKNSPRWEMFAFLPIRFK